MKKFNLEYIRSEFEKDGYTLLSEEYVNNKTKLDYICSKEHDHSITWGHWQQGVRCPTCTRVKLSIEQIKNSFKKEEYILLSKKYKNPHAKLDYKCSKGHEHSMRWNDWQQGVRCAVCSGKIKYTLDQVKKYFESDGYTLLSKEYKNCITKLNYRCDNGHEHSITLSHWLNGRRCAICDDILKSGHGSHFWRGGISYEPYCEVWKDKEYKQDIRNRDGNRCLNPGCDSKNPNDLTIHHIDYNKKNCRPSNLITVCRSCNGVANKDRDWHTTWYQAIIKNRYYGGTKWQ